MSDKDLKNQVEITSLPIKELLTKPEREVDAHDLTNSSKKERSFPFTREVVERLINRLEEV